jgi:hypothetical protein
MTSVDSREVYAALGISDEETPFDEFFYRGILRIKNFDNLSLPAEPYYIVELAGGKKVNSTVAVYDAKPELDENGRPLLDENGNWVAYKQYKDTVIDDNKKFSDKTKLSRLANTYISKITPTKKQKHKVRVYQKPLYVTELEIGVNTFTKKYGLGFKDYETELIENIRYKVKPTGVFVGIDSIRDWSAPTIKPETVLKFVQEHEQEKKSNPYFTAKW